MTNRNVLRYLNTRTNEKLSGQDVYKTISPWIDAKLNLDRIISQLEAMGIVRSNGEKWDNNKLESFISYHRYKPHYLISKTPSESLIKNNNDDKIQKKLDEIIFMVMKMKSEINEKGLSNAR